MNVLTRTMEIGAIKIGKRHRQDMGDIEGLAKSIAEIGLLHPVVVTSGGKLIAGERRIRAFRKLGRSDIPATVIDLTKIARGEYAENFFRKAFAPSEIVAITDALVPAASAEAHERKREAGKTKGKGQVTGSSRKLSRAPTALDRVGKAVGKDRKTIVKARAICEAAQADPKRFNKLKMDMDRTGRVDGPFKRLNVIRQAAAIRAEPPPYPARGPYRVIVADPPWPYEISTQDPSHRATHPYPQMSIADICAEAAKVNAIAAPDCILWLWTTNFHMREAFGVLDQWGFNQKTILTWVKEQDGEGRLAARPDGALPCGRAWKTRR